MSKVMVTESYLKDIGDAIRAQLGGTTKYLPGQMAAAIRSITTGGASASYTPNSGSGRVQIAESHLTDIADAIRDKLGVDTLYLPSQLAAAIRSIAPGTELDFKLTSNLTQPIYFTQSVANGVTINWGDGSAAETVADLSATVSHTYASAGDYVVCMTAANGATWSPGATISGKDYCIIGQDRTPKSSSYPTLVAVRYGEGARLDKPRAFAFCTGLETVILPNEISSIPDGCFGACNALRTINLPTSLQSIGQGAFQYCTNLESITFPSSLKTIGIAAFDGCSSLNRIYIPDTVESVGSAAFSNSGLETAEVAASLLDKSDLSYPSIFGYSDHLTAIWLRDSVETIRCQSEKAGLVFGCKDATIYVEKNTKPSGWNSYFDIVMVTTENGIKTITRAPVVYGQTTRPW